MKAAYFKFLFFLAAVSFSVLVGLLVYGIGRFWRRPNPAGGVSGSDQGGAP